MTPRQAAALTFLRDHFARHAWGPTYRQIGAAVGGASTSSVRRDLDVLTNLGLIRRLSGRACAIQLVAQPLERGARVGQGLRVPTAPFGLAVVLPLIAPRPPR